jgi:predicted RNase H-like HicB family nuclease
VLIFILEVRRMKYPVVVHQSEYGYDAHCPLLPGCHSQGDTLEEALENIKDAIYSYLAMISEEEKGSLYEVEVAV